MSSSDQNDNNHVLYLERIEIVAPTKKRFRVKLRSGNRDIEIHQEKGSSIWIPARSLELEGEPNVTLIVKAGYKVVGVSLGAQEARAKFSGQEAMDAFWKSTDWITRIATLDQQPVTITFKFRPSTTVDPIISTVFSIANGAFEFLNKQKKYDAMASDLAEGIGWIRGFATLTLDEIVCDESELLDRAVRNMCALIADAANFICAYAKQHSGVRAVEAEATGAHIKIKALHDGFAKLKEDFDRAVHAEALMWMRQTEKSRLRDRLQPVDGASHEKDHACMEGTRIAVLDDAITWALRRDTPLNGSNAENIYWLYGLPGLGKTSVANSLCERLDKIGNLGGSFFCKHNDPILRQPKQVLPTLIFRLAEKWSPYRKLVAQALQDDPRLNPGSAGGVILLKLLKSVQRHPPSSFVLVVDALDECGEPDTRRPLLNSLLEACVQVPWLKIIVTSRPEHDMERFFRKHPIASRDLATDDPTREDITLFTRSSMASIAQRHNLFDWPNEERLQQIVQRSGGLFIFVETLRRFVDQPDAAPLLAQVLDGDLKEANAELYMLYLATITTRVGPHTDAFRSVAQAIVVVAKYRPLCDYTLASLLRLKPSMVRMLIDELSPLLYRDRNGNGIRVRHLSVTEFLTGPSCPSEFRVDIRRANAHLSVHCLLTMTKELKFNICCLETSLLANAEIQDLDARVQQNIPDALQYSCMYWSNHVCFDSGPASAEVLVLLDEFLTGPRPLYWIEVLSVMGRVPVAISALRQIKSCNKIFEETQKELFDDMLRFLVAFFTPILTSTPHLYISGVPFMPTESKLWKNASNSFPMGISVCKGRMQSWPTFPGIWLGHTSFVSSVAYSWDGQYVASGSYDKTIRIWDAETGTTLGEPLRGHDGGISSVSYSPDGRRIVSGSEDMTIRIWDAETREAVGEPLKGHSGVVLSVAHSPDGRRVASGSSDKTIRIWDAETGAALGEPLRGHDGGISSVSYSPDGRCVVSGSEDQTIRIWDAETGGAMGEPLKGHEGFVHSVACSPDGRRVVSCSSDKTLRIWDAETGEAVGGALKGHDGIVLTVVYSPDGRRVVSGSYDKTIRIWDAETGEAVGEPLRGHADYIDSIAYSPDGQRVVSGSYDKTIRVWDAEIGEAVGELPRGHTNHIQSVAYSPDGRCVVSGSEDKTIEIWDAETGAALGEPLRGHDGSVSSVAYSPDGRQVVSGSEDRTIRIWDAETGEAVGEPLMGHTDYIHSIACSPDGWRVVSCSSDKTLRIWDAETGEAMGGALKGHDGIVLTVVYSPDGRRVVSGSYDKTIRIWDAETGETVGEPLKGHDGTVLTVAYSPDGHRVISGSEDKTIRIWNAATGEAVGEPLRGHTDYIDSIAYSPDGRRVVSGSYDKTIRIWDAETGEAVGEPLRGHTNHVVSVAYSSDGRHVISGSSDNTIKIWEANSDDEGGAHSNSTHSLLFPDDRLSLSLQSGRPIRAEMLDSDGWIRSANGPLIWIPEDCRDGLTSHAIMTLPNGSHCRCVRLDFTHLQYGTTWTNVFAGPMQEKNGSSRPHSDTMAIGEDTGFGFPEDPEFNSSYPPTPFASTGGAGLRAVSRAEKMAERGDGQLENLDSGISPEDLLILGHELSRLETRPTDIQQGIIERVRSWYLRRSSVTEDIRRRSFQSNAGYSHAVQLHALNFELTETSIRVDENSTLSQIDFLLYDPDAKTLPVALEQTCGPFPKWSIPNIHSNIGRSFRKVYIADITEPFTLALVRDVDAEEDFPLLIPLASFHESAFTVGELVDSLLLKRTKRRLSIRLLSGCDDIQAMSWDEIRKDIKGLYSTTIFVLLNGDREEYKVSLSVLDDGFYALNVWKFRYDYNCPSPLPLKVAFLQCLGLVDDAAELDAFSLQAIQLSQALLHLIICLAEEAHQSPMEESLEAHYISRAKSRVAKLKSIISDIKSSEDNTLMLVRTSLSEFFEEICEEHPGVVSVRRSFDSFQALATLDLRDCGPSPQSPNGKTTAT